MIKLFLIFNFFNFLKFLLILIFIVNFKESFDIFMAGNYDLFSFRFMFTLGVSIVLYYFFLFFRKLFLVTQDFNPDFLRRISRIEKWKRNKISRIKSTRVN